jgi:hypothetical protein
MAGDLVPINPDEFLQNIFDEGELSRAATVKEYLTVQRELGYGG